LKKALNAFRNENLNSMEDEAEFAIMLSGIIDEEENLESEKIMYTCYYVWRLFRKYSEKNSDSCIRHATLQCLA